MRILLALVFFCGACSSVNEFNGAVGEESGICYPNATCNMGLVCIDDTCEKADEGGEAGPCYPNQTCDAGLVCLQNICTPMAADAGTPDAAVPVSCSSSSSFNYVLSALSVPESATESQVLALDIDGDGSKDNALGGLLGALSSSAGLGTQAVNNEQVDSGSFIQLFSLETTVLTDASSAHVCTYRGASPSIQPCTDLDDPNTCGQHLAGTASFSIAVDTPATTAVAGSIASGDFFSPSSATSTTAFVALSLFDVTPVVLPLFSARITAETSASGLMSGSIGGGLSEATVDNVFIPALALSIQGRIENDCTPVGMACGCVSESAGESLLNFFDTNSDCSVPAEELLANSLIGATLRNPDTDLLDSAGNPGQDGVLDHLSASFGFSAVSATF